MALSKYEEEVLQKWMSIVTRINAKETNIFLQKRPIILWTSHAAHIWMALSKYEEEVLQKWMSIVTQMNEARHTHLVFCNQLIKLAVFASQLIFEVAHHLLCWRCLYICMYVHIYICICICMYAYKYIYTHIYIHVYWSLCTLLRIIGLFSRM